MKKIFNLILIFFIFYKILKVNKKEKFSSVITDSYVRSMLESPESDPASVINQNPRIDLSIFGETKSNSQNNSVVVESPSSQTVLAAPDLLSLSGFSDINTIGDQSALAALSQVGIGKARNILDDSSYGSFVSAIPIRNRESDGRDFYLSDPPDHVINK